MSALFTEMRENSRALSTATFDRFNDQGVSRAALIGSVPDGRMLIGDVSALNPISAAQVQFDGDTFDFDNGPDAVSACVWYALNSTGDPVDIVAFVPSSGVMATMLGRASMLGLEQLFAPRLDALPIHESLLDWLRADRRGIFLIDVGRARHVLLDAGPFVVSSRKLRTKLVDALTVRPQISIAVQGSSRSRLAA